MLIYRKISTKALIETNPQKVEEILTNGETDQVRPEKKKVNLSKRPPPVPIR